MKRELNDKQQEGVSRPEQGSRPTKNELEMMRIKLEERKSADEARKWVAIADAIKAVFKYLAYIALAICIYLSIRETYHDVPALFVWAKDLIDKMFLSRAVYILTILILFVIQRFKSWRNKRLVKKVGDFRHQLEHNDTCNERSGLDEHGNAQEDKG